jgi:hypothetical protein
MYRRNATNYLNLSWRGPSLQIAIFDEEEGMKKLLLDKNGMPIGSMKVVFYRDLYLFVRA